MSSSRPLPNQIHPQRRMNQIAGAIEWEELPSLADTLSERMVNLGNRGRDFKPANGFAGPWDATMPAAFDPIVESGPFQESLNGLATRELLEPDVFRHFFP